MKHKGRLIVVLAVLAVVLVFILQPNMLSQLSGSTMLYFQQESSPEFAAYDAFSVSPDPVAKGGSITFAAKWRDTGDNVRMLVCKDDGLAGGATLLQKCSTGAWCETSFSSKAGGSAFETIICTTIVDAQNIGIVDYYLFLCDNHNICSTSSKHGRFEIVRNQAPSLNSITLSKTTAIRGESLKFTASWGDPNLRDKAKLIVCSKDTNACGKDDIFCDSGFSLTSPVSCTYPVPATTEAGTKYYYAYVCDLAGGTCSKITPATKGTFNINVAPSVTRVSSEPASVTAGKQITFNVNWSDPDTKGEAANLWVCKENQFDQKAKTCSFVSGKKWCEPASKVVFSSDSTLKCHATVSLSETPGRKAYYAFVCDDEGLCSGTSGTHVGYITVVAPGS